MGPVPQLPTSSTTEPRLPLFLWTRYTRENFSIIRIQCTKRVEELCLCVCRVQKSCSYLTRSTSTLRYPTGTPRDHGSGTSRSRYVGDQSTSAGTGQSTGGGGVPEPTLPSTIFTDGTPPSFRRVSYPKGRLSSPTRRQTLLGSSNLLTLPLLARVPPSGQRQDLDSVSGLGRHTCPSLGPVSGLSREGRRATRP